MAILSIRKILWKSEKRKLILGISSPAIGGLIPRRQIPRTGESAVIRGTKKGGARARLLCTALS
jgi:hypothetical protein